jgi:hypothetical protein
MYVCMYVYRQRIAADEGVCVCVRILCCPSRCLHQFYVFLTDSALFVYLSSCCLHPSTSHQTVIHYLCTDG